MLDAESQNCTLNNNATIYPLADEPEGIDAQVMPLLDRGFRHLKICVDPWWAEPARVRRNLTHLRDLVGSERSLMLDVAQEFTRLDELAPFLDLLAELDFAWIEAPFPLDRVDEHVRLRAATRIPIGVGDLGLTTCKEFAPFLAADAFDIAQPDLTMFGGFSEGLRLARMLEGSGRRIGNRKKRDLKIEASPTTSMGTYMIARMTAM